jgi:hypothetical protein
MKLKILQDGPYNGKDGRVIDCRAGDEIQTSPAYGQSLVDSGYAECTEDDEPIETPKKRSGKNSGGKKGSKNASPASPFNPFVGG